MNTRELDSPSERMAEAEEIKKKLSADSARDRDLEWTGDEMCTITSWMVTPEESKSLVVLKCSHIVAYLGASNSKSLEYYITLVR